MLECSGWSCDWAAQLARERFTCRPPGRGALHLPGRGALHLRRCKHVRLPSVSRNTGFVTGWAEILQRSSLHFCMSPPEGRRSHYTPA